MDTSKKYIKMCEKAIDIQSHVPEVNDFYYAKWSSFPDPNDKKEVLKHAEEYAKNYCVGGEYEEKRALPYEEELQRWIKFYSDERNVQWDCTPEIIQSRKDHDDVEGLNEDCFDEYHKFIWLPQQEQLQEMTRGASPLLKLESFCDFCFKQITKCTIQRNEYVDYFRSMEQLWLAFVMLEKYRKIWTGHKWSLSFIGKLDIRGG